MNSLDRHRPLLLELYHSALMAANGRRLITEHCSVDSGRWVYRRDGVRIEMPLPRSADQGRVIAVGAGKAVASLGAGLEELLGNQLSQGILVVKHGHTENLSRLNTLEAGHPVPDAAGVAGTLAILQEIQAVGADDTVFVLLTGGASALLVQPAAGLELSDKVVVNQALLRVGADISEINVVRRHLSSVKGGGLAGRMNGARFCTLVISDVVGDDLTTIASGPTVPDPSTFRDAWTVIARYDLVDRLPKRVIDHLQRGLSGLIPETAKPGTLDASNGRHIVLANNGTALSAIAERSKTLGMRTIILPTPLVGDTHQAAISIASEVRRVRAHKSPGDGPTVIIAGGETTLEVTGTGRGGRNQEFAMVAAMNLAGIPGCSLLAAGTDGTDGPTDVTGAFIDGQTIRRAESMQLNPRAILADNDSYSLFDALDDHLRTGPTGTNVMDVCIAIVD